MKTILVPLDFSECGERALNTACLIAQKTKSEILLLHVLPPVQHSPTLGGAGQWNGENEASSENHYMMLFLKKTKHRMEAVLDKVRSRGIPVSDIIESGPISDRICSAALKHKVELIVMGTHGARGLNEVFIGSNAAHVVRDAEVPVISVKNGEPQQIRTILFATDFSFETGLAVPALKGFAQKFGADLHLVKVLSAKDTEEMDDAIQSGKRFVADNGLGNAPVTVLQHIDTKEHGILRHAKAAGADMIAIGTHGRHGLARFFAGSIAEEIVNHASLPVLTINFHGKLEEARSQAERDAILKIRAERKAAPGYSGHIPLV